MKYARRLPRALPMLSLVFALACGAGQRPAEHAPVAQSDDLAVDAVSSGAEEPRLETLDFEQASLALARAERRVAQLLGEDRMRPKRKNEAKERVSSAAADEAPSAAPAPAAPAPALDADEAAAGSARVLNRCQLLCRALASMQHATERLCELTGPEEGQCVDAQERLADVRQRVRERCPECSVAADGDE